MRDIGGRTGGHTRRMDRPADVPTVVAVYGTLRASCRNHGLLDRAEPLGPGRIDGSLWWVETGEHRAYPYPALLLQPGGPVAIECYRVTSLEQLAALDRLEAYVPEDEPASEYVRRTVPVSGGPVPWAQVYVYRGPHEVLRGQIPNGDWVAAGGG